MPDYHFLVVVEAASESLAEEVIAMRLNYDEEYTSTDRGYPDGFHYTINWAPTNAPVPQKTDP